MLAAARIGAVHRVAGEQGGFAISGSRQTIHKKVRVWVFTRRRGGRGEEKKRDRLTSMSPRLR
jgi:hypothetical protein